MRASWQRTLTGAVVAIALAVVFAGGTRAQQRGTTPPVNPKKSPTEPWPDAATIEAHRVSSENRRMFRSDDPVPFTLTADFKAVNGDRDPKSTKSYPATIDFTGDDGKPRSMAIQIKPRGHVRREMCANVPLRLEFPKDQTKGTIFDGAGTLKLGTHCRSDFEEYVLRELAAYKIYNLLTNKSFRARPAKATYVDAKTHKTLETRDAMFIEDDDDVARRLGGRIVDIQSLTFARVDLDTVTLMTLFEYMIGNTDMSLFSEHNVRIVQTPAGLRYTIPYDFDYSGIVDTPYAIPGKELQLTSVRDRLYRGPCRTAAELEPFFVKLQSYRPAITALYTRLPFIKPGDRTDSEGYLDKFYRTLDHPGDIRHEFVDGCKRPYM